MGTITPPIRNKDMILDFRICKIDDGWIVEKLTFKYRFLGLYFHRVWRPYVTSFGANKEYFFKDKQSALLALLSQVEKETDCLFYEDYIITPSFEFDQILKK